MIRFAALSDIPQLLEVYGPYVLTSTATFEYEVPPEEAFRQRFLAITAQYPWLVWEEEGCILGYAYASPPYTRAAYAWCAEPTVYLRPQAQGRGIAAKLYGCLEALLRRQGYQVLYALVTGENAKSLAFHQKCGYFPRAFFPDCGFKFGRWLGLYWLEKRLCDVKIPNQAPLPWLSIVQGAESSCRFLEDLLIS